MAQLGTSICRPFLERNASVPRRPAGRWKKRMAGGGRGRKDGSGEPCNEYQFLFRGSHHIWLTGFRSRTLRGRPKNHDGSRVRLPRSEIVTYARRRGRLRVADSHRRLRDHNGRQCLGPSVRFQRAGPGSVVRTKKAKRRDASRRICSTGEDGVVNTIAMPFLVYFFTVSRTPRQALWQQVGLFSG